MRRSDNLITMWWEPVFVMAVFLTPASDGFFFGTSDGDTDSDRPAVARRRDSGSRRSVDKAGQCATEEGLLITGVQG